MNIFRKNRVKFVDRFHNAFWLYQDEDKIQYNKKRRSVTDAVNIINYLYNNDIDLNVGIDIGANIGAVSIAMWNKTKAGKGEIYSIEADPFNIRRILENLALNEKSLSNVVNLAISDRAGHIKLTRFPNSNGWQTISDEIADHAQNVYHETVKVNSNTLENFLSFYNLRDVDLIKIDIEGAELLALRSIRSRLEKREVKKIIFEANQLTLKPFREDINSLLSFWDNLPYQIKVIQEDGSTSALDQVLENEVKFFDCVAELT